jgi:hypothetical protein
MRSAAFLGMALGFAAIFPASLHAQAPTPMMAPTASSPAPASAPGKTAPAVAAAGTNKVVAPVPPPPPPQVPDTFNRYGKIWAPSDDAAHPLKLNMQFPGVGEMKIPSQDELGVREKLEQLATLSDDDIRKQLAQWPPFNKMNLRDEGQMLMRIQQFKDQRSKVAGDKAHDLGLTLNPDQKARFEKEYWDKQLQVDRDMAKQFEPALKAREQKMKEELFRDFSTPGAVNPLAAAPKPPAPAATPTPPAPTPPKPAPPVAAQPKPAPSTTVGTNAGMPVAQGVKH